jgi:TPR repeat protein
MYDTGRGVAQDDVEAMKWYRKAAAQGNDGAEHNKKLIAESMTREQRARAQELARQYWEAYVLPFRN